MTKEHRGSELPIGGVPHCVLDCGRVLPPDQGVYTQKHVNKLVSRMSESWMWCPSHSVTYFSKDDLMDDCVNSNLEPQKCSKVGNGRQDASER